MKFPKIYTCAIGVLLLMFSGPLVPVEAWQSRLAPDEVVEARIGYMGLKHATKRKAHSIMSIRIDNMKLAAELSDKQVKKLEIAAKGAIKSYMVRVKARLVEIAVARGFEFDPDVEPEQNTKEAKADPEIKPSGYTFGDELRSIEHLSGVEEEEIWKSAVKNVLTDSQATRINLLNERRTAYSQSAAVSKYISLIDQELLLNPEQKEQLWNAVNEKYGKLITNQYDHLSSSHLAHRRTSYGAEIATGKEDKVSEMDLSLVDEILSESQLELWKTRFGFELLETKEWDEVQQRRRAKKQEAKQ